MAEPAAVPGVDPSRVSTTDELAACLDGLRRRRGLSYEAMERAAKLASRSGGSRPEPLHKSTVGEIITGRRLPTQGKLRTFLEVCKVAQADYAQWLAAWERASTADLARPAGAVRIRDALPRLLGVHAAIQVEEKVPGELPVYVPRDIDDGLRAALAADAEQGCFVLLIGGSSVGKTRTLYEAVLAALPDWWLVHPASPGEVAELATVPTPRTVVWLDELQRYLDGEHGLTGGVVRALLGPPYPVVIIGTLWPDRYAAYTALPAPGVAHTALPAPDPHAREREVLDLAEAIRIAPAFSPTEQDRARAAADRDPRLKIALGAAGYGLTQTLAAAPQLVGRWQDAQAAEPYAWAVLTAALDVARLGARAPLSPDLLRAAAPGYCTSQQQAEAPDNWFEQALAYATSKLHGVAAALSPAGSGMGQVAGYTPADFLVQHASRARHHARVPASTWDAVLSHLRDPADNARLADSADSRLLYSYAIPLYRNAADADNQDSAVRLAELLAARGDLTELRAQVDARGTVRSVFMLAGHGDIDWLRARADAGKEGAAFGLALVLGQRGDLEGLCARADAGYKDAAFVLAVLLGQRGDLEGLRARANVGDEYAAWELAELLGQRGDLEGLRARADAGDREAAGKLADLLLADRDDIDGLHVLADAGDGVAAGRLAELLGQRGDLEGLRARADAGHRSAAWRLAKLLGQHADLEGLRARADAGNEYAARELADLLVERGDLEGLRARADAGNEYAARELADLLVERGDLEGLRARADAGDEYAARELADLLVERGDLEGLRARADVGDEYAARELADLLVERGDLEGLRARADAGDQAAAGKLADLLVKQGRDEEADRLRRFGLNLDGSIASG